MDSSRCACPTAILRGSSPFVNAQPNVSGGSWGRLTHRRELIAVRVREFEPPKLGGRRAVDEAFGARPGG
jgi:hypothetical protein